LISTPLHQKGGKKGRLWSPTVLGKRRSEVGGKGKKRTDLPSIIRVRGKKKKKEEKKGAGKFCNHTREPGGKERLQ